MKLTWPVVAPTLGYYLSPSGLGLTLCSPGSEARTSKVHHSVVGCPRSAYRGIERKDPGPEQVGLGRPPPSINLPVRPSCFAGIPFCTKPASGLRALLRTKVLKPKDEGSKAKGTRIPTH